MRRLLFLLLVGCAPGALEAPGDAGSADARAPACPIVVGLDECHGQLADGTRCFVCHATPAAVDCYLPDGYCVGGCGDVRCE